MKVKCIDDRNSCLMLKCGEIYEVTESLGDVYYLMSPPAGPNSWLKNRFVVVVDNERLFDEHACYTSLAQDISQEATDALKEIIAKYPHVDVRDLQSVIHGAAFDAALEMILYRKG